MAEAGPDYCEIQVRTFIGGLVEQRDQTDF
jgi:hypothetical protein